MRSVVHALLGLALVLSGCGSSDPWWEEDRDKSEPVSAVKGQRLEDAKHFDSTLTNLHQIIADLNLAQAHAAGAYGQGTTIAILDNGFAGLSSSLGTRLPPDLRIEPSKHNEPAEEPHGTKMAEIAYAVATGSVNYLPDRPGPNLLLYNTYGYPNFVDAVDDLVDNLIERKVDMVLYAQIWEYGGNMDGTGFISAVVKRAIQAGILWINAAGNYGKSAYSGDLVIGKDGYVVLPYMKRYVRVNVAQETPVNISLGWNDFTDNNAYRTEQDLDLELYDQFGTKLSESAKVQDGRQPSHDGTDRLAHAAEVIKTVLPAGQYWLAVKAKSRNFRSDSRLWLAVNGPNLEVLDPGDGNSIFNPAADPPVMTVGASDVDFSSSRPLSFGPAKPEVLSISHVHFDDGRSYAGTSAASAITAGALAAISTYRYGKLSKSLLMRLLHGGHISTSQMNLGPNRPQPPVLQLPNSFPVDKERTELTTERDSER